MRVARVSPVDAAIPVAFVAGLEWQGWHRRVEVIRRSDVDEIEEIAADARTEGVGHGFGVTVERHAGGGDTVEVATHRIRLSDQVDRHVDRDESRRRRCVGAGDLRRSGVGHRDTAREFERVLADPECRCAAGHRFHISVEKGTTVRVAPRWHFPLRAPDERRALRADARREAPQVTDQGFDLVLRLITRQRDLGAEDFKVGLVGRADAGRIERREVFADGHRVDATRGAVDDR